MFDSVALVASLFKNKYECFMASGGGKNERGSSSIGDR